MSTRKLAVVCALVVAAVAVPLSAAAPVDDATSTFTYTKNMHPLGYSPRVVPLANAEPGSGVFNSDLAFWGRTAVQGTYAGFRLVDVSDPENPSETVNWTECASPTNTVGNQGDVIVWDDIVIRSWNSGTPAPRYPAGHPMAGQTIPVTDPARFTTPGAFCGDWPMFREPAAPPLPERGQEGVHIIDISDPQNPDVIAFVDTPCGSHTETLAPDLENNRLIVYNNPSSGNVFGGAAGDPNQTVSCAGMDVIEVPLDDPASASYLRFEPAGHEGEDPEDHHPCHDSAVILGDVMRLACAGVPGAAVYSLEEEDGGSIEDPMFLYNVTTGGSGIGHSASFTWDGKILIVGHEPGGGSGARCDATDPIVERTFFFHNIESNEEGPQVGRFAIPRLQTNTENCTTHNYNVVPTDKRYVMVSGNYQSGISVIDFTNPAAATEIAFADPAPLVNPDNPAGIELGGDWSTYWYNGILYESDILRGLITWRLSDRAVAGAKRLSHLNPQTQETSFALRR